MSAVLAIENAGYIYGSYVLTFAVVAAYAWRALRRGRDLGELIDDTDKYWT